MRISKSIIDTINDLITDRPPETGGILGSRNGVIIDEVIVDVPGQINSRPCSYSPNTNFLNRKIDKWQKEGVSFMGIFHTHFVGVRTLSCGDKKYITDIMNAMPQNVYCLYFPVFVLPQRELVCYRAERINGIVDIQAEELVLE